MCTLDTAIITTALIQVMDEGVIDESDKRCVRVAICRQRHPVVRQF